MNNEPRVRWKGFSVRGVQKFQREHSSEEDNRGRWQGKMSQQDCHNLLTFVSDQTWHVYDTGCGPSSVGSSPLLCLPPIAATADVFFRQCLGLWIKCFEYPYSELMSGVVSIVQSRLPRAVRVLAGVLDTRGLVPRPRPPPRPARPREGPHPRRGSRRLPRAEVCRDDAPLSAGGQPGALQYLHR